MSEAYSGYTGMVSQAQQATFVEGLKTPLQQWFAQWFVGADQQTLAVEQVDFNQQLFGASEQVVNGAQIVLSDEMMCCYLAERNGEELVECALGQAAITSEDQQLMNVIRQKMVAQLGQLFYVTAPASEYGDICQSYVCQISVMMAGVRMVLLFDGAYLHRFSLQQQSEQRPLQQLTCPPVSLKQMVAKQSVSIPVTMCPKAVTVKQLLALQPGHVIPLKQLIEQPLLTGADSGTDTGNGADPLRFTGHLVKREGNKAIYLTGGNKQ